MSSGEAAMWGYDVASDVRDGPNLYAYVMQNPWTAFDPHGLWSWSAFAEGFAYAAGAVAVVALAPVILPAMAASVVTATVFTISVASTAIVATELATNRHVEIGMSGIGLSKTTLSEEDRDRRISGLVGGIVGGGLTGKFIAPKLRGLTPEGRADTMAIAAAKEHAASSEGGSSTAGVSPKGDVLATGSKNARVVQNGQVQPGQQQIPSSEVAASYQQANGNPNPPARLTCGEPRLNTLAAERGIDMRGGTMATVRNAPSPNAGTPIPACDTCRPFLRQEGIRDAVVESTRGRYQPPIGSQDNDKQ